MKTKQLTLGIALVATVSAGIFSSCKKKEKVEEKDSDTAGASDQSLASTTINWYLRQSGNCNHQRKYIYNYITII